MLILLDVHPTLAAWGQAAAIVILLFMSIFIVICVAFNLVMAFGLAWVREKANLIKLLRPTVDSVNRTSEAAIQGREPSSDENPVIRTVADIPARVHTVDKKVEETTDKVNNAVIEFRARTMQVKGIVQAFISPPSRKAIAQERAELGENSPGYQQVMERAGEPVVELTPSPAARNGEERGMTATQRRDVPSR